MNSIYCRKPVTAKLLTLDIVLLHVVSYLGDILLPSAKLPLGEPVFSLFFDRQALYTDMQMMLSATVKYKYSDQGITFAPL